MYIILIVININNRLRLKKQKITRLANAVQSLRLLLEYLAKHRGMTNAYLKGDHSFKSEIDSLQTNVDHVFTSLTQETNTEISWDNIPEYTNMKTEWNSLKSRVFERSPKQNFDLHIALIGKVIENIAEEGLYIETALSNNPNTKIITNILITGLPPSKSQL